MNGCAAPDVSVGLSFDRAALEALLEDLLTRRGAAESRIQTEVTEFGKLDEAVHAIEAVLRCSALLGPAASPVQPIEPSVQLPAPTADSWDERRERARVMYLQGTGPQAISDTLQVSIRRVDKWVQRGRWAEQKRALLQERAADPPPRLESVPELKQRAKALFLEGYKAADIAAAIGRPLQHIYEWSSKGKWAAERDRLNKGAAAPEHPEIAEAKERLRARREADDRVIDEVRDQVNREQQERHERGIELSRGSLTKAGAFEE